MGVAQKRNLILYVKHVKVTLKDLFKNFRNLVLFNALPPMRPI